MILTKNWLNEWIDVENESVERLCEIFNSIGLEVDSAQTFTMPEKVVVGYVEDKEKHPDADKLNVCQVDVGSEKLQIVCGAKNVDKGQYVAVATNGAKLPDGMKIKKAKLRGVESNGMICSSTELGLPKINDGIMVLDESIGELKTGKELSEYPLLNDSSIELELTANRGDCLSIRGVARDLSAVLDKDLKEIPVLEEDENLLGIGRILTLHVDEEVKSSLKYKAMEVSENRDNLLMRLRLALVEFPCENAVQRVANYATYSTGVLLRVYDFADFADGDKATISIKKTPEGFDGVYGNDKLITKIGYFQEKSENISDAKQVMVECSYINPEEISKLAMENKSEKSDFHFYRSSRGSEPELDIGAKYFEYLLENESGIKPYGGVQMSMVDCENKMINFDVNEANAIIGKEIDKNEIVQILKRLGFELSITSEDTMSIKVPLYRHDISGVQDICEEIVRIVGIENIPSKPYEYKEISRVNRALVGYKKRYNICYKSVAAGFFESIHYVFDNREKMEKYGLVPIYKQRDVANPITNELNTLRTTLALHLIEAASFNVKNSRDKVALFEIGKTFNQKREESDKIAWLYSGLNEAPSIKNHGKPSNINFEAFAEKVSRVIGKFELVQSTPEDKLYSPYEFADVLIDGEKVGFMARFHIKVENEHDVPATYICELDFAKLNLDIKTAKPYSKFQISTRDLSLLVPKDMSYKSIKECIENLKIKRLIKFAPVDRFESEELGDNVSLSVKFSFQDEEKTLEDEDINKMIQTILEELETNLAVKLR